MKASLISINGWWHLRVRGDGRNLTRTLKSKDEALAQHALQNVNAQLGLRGDKALMKLGDMVVGQFCISRRKGVSMLKTDTVERYKISLELFRNWCSSQGVTLAMDVQETLVRRYAEHLSQSISGGTVRSHLMALAKVWTDNAIPNTPFHSKNVRPLVVEGTRDEISAPELRAILAVNEGRGEIEGILFFGVYCGMRLGDIVNLRWEHIRYGELNIRTRKTGFLLNFKLPPVLETWLRRYKRGGLLHGEGFLFPDLQKRYVRSRSSVSGRLNRAIAKVIPRRTERAPNRARAISRYSFHSFRHAFCMRLVESGESFTQIRKLTGTSLRLLMTRYGDHIKKRDCDRAVREASNRLDSHIGGEI